MQSISRTDKFVLASSLDNALKRDLIMDEDFRRIMKIIKLAIIREVMKK